MKFRKKLFTHPNMLINFYSHQDTIIYLLQNVKLDKTYRFEIAPTAVVIYKPEVWRSTLVKALA